MKSISHEFVIENATNVSAAKNIIATDVCVKEHSHLFVVREIAFCGQVYSIIIFLGTDLGTTFSKIQ